MRGKWMHETTFMILKLRKFADTGFSFPHICLTVFVLSNVRNCGNIDNSILKRQEVVPKSNSMRKEINTGK